MNGDGPGARQSSAGRFGAPSAFSVRAAPWYSCGVLPQELLDVLVCPKSTQPLIYFPHGAAEGLRGAGDSAPQAAGFLLCPASRLRYPIQDGVPVMLVEEAVELTSAEVEELLAQARQRGMRTA